jgi:uncharacterized protein
VRVYSETDPDALNYRPAAGSYDYYLNPERGNVPEYRNQFAVAGLDELLDFDPLSRAGSITPPTIVVHSDGSAFPQEARRLSTAFRARKSWCGPTGTISTTTTHKPKSRARSQT